MGAKYITQGTSGYDSSPPSDDGSQTASNLITWAGIKSKLTTVLKTFAEAINTSLVNAFDYSVRSVTSGDNTVASDHMRCVEIASTVTTAITIALGDASTMTNVYRVFVKNSSALNQTLSRVTAGDTIDGVTANVTLAPKSGVIVQTNAAANGYVTVGAAQPLGLGVPRGYISGLTYSNNVGDATNDLDIAVGEAADGSNLRVIKLASALTKQSDAAWAVGTNAGGLDTGAVGNSDYYIWLIQRSDTGVVDVLYSLSSTAPTMPANYDFKRLIGWFKRVGATIVAFHTYEAEGGGLEMNWDVPTLDVNLANTLTTARRTDAVKVPLNFSTTANLNVVVSDAGGAVINICCPDQTDAAPSTTVAPLSNLSITVGGQVFNSLMVIRTSAAGLIAARATAATIDLYAVSTIGFRWARKN